MTNHEHEPSAKDMPHRKLTILGQNAIGRHPDQSLFYVDPDTTVSRLRTYSGSNPDHFEAIDGKAIDPITGKLVHRLYKSEC